eukprot:CAMPEP_0170549728 /NCGR_PEP_ID=MMETSP0211-20121228/7877_1 /TAXON_ID=311385 /ORGANISM="Pseudokeronopsis sp., Strain OXSARD2" /LENGTH=62 /DNA_ID=CAMNT_0010855919 /DNA_START=509 /DNA_END=697 /DNA_ORIENTATION=-
MTEELVKDINIGQLNERLIGVQQKSNESEKKYFYLECKVKLISSLLDKKINKLENDKKKALE